MKKLKSKFVRMWLIITIVAGFAAVIFFIITYIQNKILCELHCAQRNEVIIALIAIGLFGLFIGSLMYYLMSEKREKDISEISTKTQKHALSTLSFLDAEERIIIKCLIKHEGELSQAKIFAETKLSRVIISRNISSLVRREIITKEPLGMTNIIKLNKDLKELFCS